jgi:hypothetical protein
MCSLPFQAHIMWYELMSELLKLTKVLGRAISGANVTTCAGVGCCGDLRPMAGVEAELVEWIQSRLGDVAV